MQGGFWLWSRFVPETAPLEGSRSLDLQGPFAAAASEHMVWAQAGMLAQLLLLASKVNSKRRSLLQLRVALFHNKEKIQAFKRQSISPPSLDLRRMTTGRHGPGARTARPGRRPRLLAPFLAQQPPSKRNQILIPQFPFPNIIYMIISQ